ncbi:ArsR/SmtB family transcription factor [Spiroplasma culicicola]|uniref:HTH arsR-type domain-containing protein n=1 Tax=Spiroplasma culicicola AES-1 TaxID=1276246 RepID=W6A8M9_9MOLU|nr:helix-turn-helix transcriptional regulator [Spiroplasma culicicola]AHI53245.1 hypothetical protein SCULI_v1c09050 [Spiroplasma culicicola AES-1]
MKVIEILRELNSNTKIKIMCWLMCNKKGLTVSQLVELLPAKRENISKQICELNYVGLVECKKIGRNNFYTINDKIDEIHYNLIKTIIDSYNKTDERIG